MKTKRSYASKYLKIEVLLLGSLVIASGLIAIEQLQTTARFSDLTNLNIPGADTLDVSDRDRIALLAAKSDEIVTGGICRSDVVRAGLIAVMKDLDMQDQVNQFHGWIQSLGRAERYVRYALTCNPADGDMWARMAMVSQAVGENPRRLTDIMSQSVLLSPSEISVIRARFVVWRKAAPNTLALSAKSLEKDLSTLLNYGNPGDIKDIIGIKDAASGAYVLVQPGDSLNAYVVSALTLVPQQRQSYLMAVGIKLPPAAQ